MKRLIFLLLLLFFLNNLYAQEKDIDKKLDEVKTQILKEAYQLYHSEKAAWLGTDMLQANIDKIDTKSFGGYLAYSKGKKVYCLFYDNKEPTNVLAHFEFPSSFDVKKSKANLNSRKCNKEELSYIKLRNLAIARVEEDTFFRVYPNTNYNIIPII